MNIPFGVDAEKYNRPTSWTVITQIVETQRRELFLHTPFIFRQNVFGYSLRQKFFLDNRNIQIGNRCADARHSIESAELLFGEHNALQN
jgi:hypothetical protein